MVIIAVIFLVAIGIFLLSLTFKILKRPIGWILKFLIGAWFDISLGLNWVNAAVTGVLGVPGVILLLLIKYLL